MQKKTLSKKWKILICALVVCVLMSSTGIAVWAIASNYFKYKAGFDVAVTGGRYVNATITGSSYLADSEEIYEALEPVTFDSESSNIQTSLDFNQTLPIKNDEKAVKLKFEIKNNSSYKTENDLIIKPDIENQDIEDVIFVWYYSVNDITYEEYDGEYLVAHKDDTIYLELHILATFQMLGEVEFSDAVSIELYSEIEAPEDFKYEYEYSYNGETGVATKTRKCHTCKTEGPAITMTSEEFVVVTDGLQFQGQHVEDKVLFVYNDYLVNNKDAIYFDTGLDNVVITGNTNDYDLETRLEITIFDYVAESVCNNVTIQNLDLAMDGNKVGIKVVASSMEGENAVIEPSINHLTIKDCGFNANSVGDTAIQITTKVSNLKCFRNSFGCLSNGIIITGELENASFVANSSYQIGNVISISNVSGVLRVINHDGFETNGLLSCGNCNNAKVYFINNKLAYVTSTFIYSRSQTSTIWTIYDNVFHEDNMGEIVRDIENSKLCIESGNGPSVSYEFAGN